MSELKEKIAHLKKEKDAIILAHYYVADEVQEIADFVGDSYYLSKIAAEAPEKVILFAGVRFMGESAKLLSPEKTVIMAEPLADCPMAHMVDVEKIEEITRTHEDVAVVCYINSTAEIKMYADVCVTSSNAMKIVENLPHKNIFFIPDENLGRYIASKLPQKHFIFNEGYCHVHKAITKADVTAAKKLHIGAEVLVHPECTPDVTAMGDYVGSTSGIITYAHKSEAQEFIICTEIGVLYELKRNNPKKRFYPARQGQICPDMKQITLQKVADALEHLSNSVELEEEMYQKSNAPLIKMLELAK